jgi:NAD(P)H dehydrogenase (quinone)
VAEILILYYSRHGSIADMARAISHGVESVADCTARLRTVPAISANCETTEEPVPEAGPPYVSQQDLEDCDGLILGSPAYFGNMASPLKYFIDGTSPQWLGGALVDKPAAVFTSSSSFHGGQETTLVSMMVPLLHHGAILVGIPYTEEALNTTTTGGTPYGATHIAGQDSRSPLSKEEKSLCKSLGKRVARIAAGLADAKS